MEITHPRRILAVSLADSAQHLSDVIRDLTGTHPVPSPAPPSDRSRSRSRSTSPSPSPEAEAEAEGEPEPSLAGTTHHLPLSTPYYTASVPVWLDLVASSPADWAASFLAPEAREVLDVLGGLLVVFALPPPPPPPAPAPPHAPTTPSSGPALLARTVMQPSSPPPPPSPSRAQTRELIAHVGRVLREGLGGWEWDGVGLGVGVSSGGLSGLGDEEDGGVWEEWEDLCAEWGMEFVHVSRGSGSSPGPAARDGGGGDERRNAFGERTGMARVLEALQANDWSGSGPGPGMGVGDDDGEGGEEEDARGKRRGDEDEDSDGFEFDPDSLDFGFDREDFVGLRKAIWAGGVGQDGEGSTGQGGGDGDDQLGDEDVQKLERMMLKLQAVRDASAGLPEQQRKRMAARAVGEVMKEL